MVELLPCFWQNTVAGNDSGRGRERWQPPKSPNHSNLTSVSCDDWHQSRSGLSTHHTEGSGYFPVFFTENGVSRIFQASSSGDQPPASFALPTYRQETMRHILLGDYAALMEAINYMVSLGYCDKIA